MNEPPPNPAPDEAERRLLALLLLLRAPDEGADASLIGSVMNRVRVQMTVRELLGVLGGLTRAVEDMLRLFVRGTQKQGP